MAMAKEARADERDITHLQPEDLDYVKTLALNKHDKKKDKKAKLTKESLVNTRKDLVNQCNYIRQEKQITEQKVTNGVACLRTAVKDYNELYKCFLDCDLGFHLLWRKIQNHPKYLKFNIPAKEINKFREVSNDWRKKDMYNELGKASNENGFDLGSGVSGL